MYFWSFSFASIRRSVSEINPLKCHTIWRDLSDNWIMVVEYLPNVIRNWWWPMKPYSNCIEPFINRYLCLNIKGDNAKPHRTEHLRKWYHLHQTTGYLLIRDLIFNKRCQLKGTQVHEILNNISHYCDVTSTPRSLQSPATELFFRQIVQAENKGNVNAVLHITFIVEQWTPLTKDAQYVKLIIPRRHHENGTFSGGVVSKLPVPMYLFDFFLGQFLLVFEV